MSVFIIFLSLILLVGFVCFTFNIGYNLHTKKKSNAIKVGLFMILIPYVFVFSYIYKSFLYSICALQ